MKRRPKKKPAAPAPTPAPQSAPGGTAALRKPPAWYDEPIRNPGQPDEAVRVGPGTDDWVRTGNPRVTGMVGMPDEMAADVHALAVEDVLRVLRGTRVRLEMDLVEAGAAWAVEAMRAVRSDESPGLLEQDLRRGLVSAALHQRIAYVEQMHDALDAARDVIERAQDVFDQALRDERRDGDEQGEGPGESGRATDGA